MLVTVYEARSSIDAHLLRGLLEQQGIEAHVIGEMLQGGSGELPAGGLVRVQVAAGDHDAARTVVADFDARAAGDPDTDMLVIGTPTPRRAPLAAGTILGIVAVVGTLLLLRWLAG